MRPLTAKQIQRIEKKKKKLAAFLEIAKLNDKDRAVCIFWLLFWLVKMALRVVKIILSIISWLVFLMVKQFFVVEAKAAFRHIRKNSEPMDMDDSISEPSSPDGPCRKRHKKNNTIHREVVVEDNHCIAVEPITCEDKHCEEKPGENKFGDSAHGDSVNSERGAPTCDKKCISFGCGHNMKTKKKKICDEYSQLKHEFKERRSRSKCVPSFRLKTIGELASLSMKEGTRNPIFLHDIQHILMYALLGQQAPVWPSRWCILEKYSRLSHLVVLLVEGISLYDYNSHCSSFQFLKTLENQLEVIMPTSYNGNLVEELISVPLTGIHKDRLIQQYGSLEAASKSSGDVYKVLRAFFPIECDETELEAPIPLSDTFSRTKLLLSMSQLIEQNYPVPTKTFSNHRYSDFVLTKDMYKDVTPVSPMFGLDCEMCRTTSGELEVTRISVVNENLEVVYESFVKPYNRITDYLTRYSGITKQSLSDVTVRLEDVQKDLRNLLPSDAILVGQSLNADLQSLKMMHPFVIDTSVIFNLTGERNRKSKLSLLSHKFLLEDIQSGNRGHCSIEDSSACIKLTQLKLANGIEYGDAVLIGRRDAERRREKKAANIAPESQEDYASSIFSHTQRAQKDAAVITVPERISEYSQCIADAENINSSTTINVKKRLKCFEELLSESVVQRTCEVAMEHHFALAHIIHPDTSEENTSTFEQLDQMCQTLWQHTAVHGLFMVLFGGKGTANGTCFVSVKKKSLFVGAKL